MTWAAIILYGVKLLGSLASWLHDRQLIQGAHAEIIAASLQEQADALRKANAAREAVRADLALHPDHGMSDDEFKRPD